MRIANNISALKALNILSSNNSALQKTIRALSSGLRINSAADDASGLAISEKMRSQIGGLDRALHNTQDGISLLQTADGALNETTAMLQRMRELAVQAANDTLTQQDRGYIQVELDQLKDEINRTARTTKFNKKKILNGEAGGLWSSSNLGVRANIRGAIGWTDQFGQYVSAEGNYDIDITASPGKAQVQTGRMFMSGHAVETTVTETIESTFTQTTYTFTTETVTGATEETIWVPDEAGELEYDEILDININTGTDRDGNTSGEGWYFDQATKRLYITKMGGYRIYGTGETTKNHVFVKPGVQADIWLENVSIDTDENTFNLRDAAFLMDDAVVNMYLIGNNYLHSGYHRSALEAPQGSYLTINSASGDGSTEGTLNTLGGTHGSGIGGCCCAFFDVPSSAGGSIVIRGGTINAKGGDLGAGIGGGQARDAGTIAIYGGDVHAYGGYMSAGIGSSAYIGDSGSATIVIAGGNVYAEGKGGGAGIGGGAYSGAGNIKIGSNMTIGGNLTAVGSTPYTYSYYSSANTVASPSIVGGLTAGDDIGAGYQYVGDYTGYQGGVDIEIPAAVAMKQETVSIPYEKTVVISEPHEEEITMTEDVDRSYTISEESTLGDFLTSSTITSSLNSEQNHSASPGSDIDETFMALGYEKLKIIQGDGQSAQITLYQGDKLSDIAKKINDAIATNLGQGQYTDDATHFCTIEEIPGSSEAIYTKQYRRDDDGSLVLDSDGNPIETGEYEASSSVSMSALVVRSAVAGKEGELYFEGSEELLKVLGFNETQKSSESTYSLTVSDAHTGEVLKQDVKITGSKAINIIADGIDVDFDSMSGICAVWNDKENKYTLTNTGTYSATLHLADNSLKLQVGANEGERFILDLGDMSADALGVSKVNVATHDTATRAITIIDNAIDIVNTQRAKIGASTNTLEHTMSRLTIASENLTQSESRIRSADLAKMMLTFTKYQIMTQSGVSMLSQANQFPQQVLSLMR